MTQMMANGIVIEYETHGKASDPALILVRGLGTQLIDWPASLLQQFVDDGFHVVVFDNRDVGLSEKFSAAGKPDMKRIAKGELSPPYTIADMAGDIVGLMDGLSVAKAHVVGISLGGMIVQVLAALNGARLLSMTSVMSSSGRPGLPGPTPAAAASLSAETDPATGAAGIIEATAQGLAVCGSPAFPESLETRLEIARRRYERCYDPAGVVRQMAAVVACGNRETYLSNISVPVHVIHGEADPLIPVEAGIDTAACVRGAQLTIIPGMGHNIPEPLVPTLAGHVTGFCHKVKAT